MSNESPQVAIVAGEASGDRLGAGLIHELRQRYPGARFTGIGGTKMQAEGFEAKYSMDRIGVIGLDGLKDKLFDILRIRKILGQHWQANPPDVFVGVDLPDFNLTLENRLKRNGIPCVHYVSPTVWAWRGYRIHKIKRSVSHMLTLFPFEARFYQKHDVPVTCVGHPMADEIATPSRVTARKALFGAADEEIDFPIIALLPGSRRNEMKRLAEPMIAAAKILYRQRPELRFVLPLAKPDLRGVFDARSGGKDDLPLTVLEGQSRLALESANVAVLASGTASLEAALLQVPHVVVYRLSRISYWLMRRLQQVNHYAMPNHLLPRPMVPELIQDAVTPDAIVRKVSDYLDDNDKSNALRAEFAKIHLSLKLDADNRAADVVSDILESGR